MRRGRLEQQKCSMLSRIRRLYRSVSSSAGDEQPYICTCRKASGSYGKGKKDRSLHKRNRAGDLKKRVRLLQKRQIAAQKETMQPHLQEGVRLRLPP